jgi:hypothetical protein
LSVFKSLSPERAVRSPIYYLKCDRPKDMGPKVTRKSATRSAMRSLERCQNTKRPNGYPHRNEMIEAALPSS